MWRFRSSRRGFSAGKADSWGDGEFRSPSRLSFIRADAEAFLLQLLANIKTLILSPEASPLEMNPDIDFVAAAEFLKSNGMGDMSGLGHLFAS